MFSEQRLTPTPGFCGRNEKVWDTRGTRTGVLRPGVDRPVAFPDDSPIRRRRDLQECVSWLLEQHPPGAMMVEKRAQRRSPFRRPFTVTPINNATSRPDQFRSFPAFGIDISPTGICFIARHLIPARKALLSLEGPGGKVVGILFEPRWVRFTRGGWYQTGGRLVELLQDSNDVMPVLSFSTPPAEVLEFCERSRHT